MKAVESISEDKAGRRIRTDDLLITNQLLYQLSYAGVFARSVAQRSPRHKPGPLHIRERMSTLSGSAVSSRFITVLR